MLLTPRLSVEINSQAIPFLPLNDLRLLLRSREKTFRRCHGSKLSRRVFAWNDHSERATLGTIHFAHFLWMDLTDIKLSVLSCGENGMFRRVPGAFGFLVLYPDRPTCYNVVEQHFGRLPRMDCVSCCVVYRWSYCIRFFLFFCFVFYSNDDYRLISWLTIKAWNVPGEIPAFPNPSQTNGRTRNLHGNTASLSIRECMNTNNRAGPVFEYLKLQKCRAFSTRVNRNSFACIEMYT